MAGGSFFFNRLVGAGRNYADSNYTVVVDPGERLADLGGHKSAHVFRHCKALVRLPARGAQQCGHLLRGPTLLSTQCPVATPISQEALTKLVLHGQLETTWLLLWGPGTRWGAR